MTDADSVGLLAESSNSGAGDRAGRAAGWSVDAVCTLLELPLNDLLYRAHGVHRENFPPNTVQLSTLLSIKTGGCPEDCKYCPQSSRYDTGVENEPLLSVDAVLAAARAARASGATRFCMGAAWRGPRDRDLHEVLELVRAVKGLGLESDKLLTTGNPEAEADRALMAKLGVAAEA